MEWSYDTPRGSPDEPANILVTKDDVVKLSDFGIARAVSEHTLGVTQAGMVMGSVAYISPEQAQGHDIDERSDLYSVGVVLYQMLTGALPFTGDNPVAVALKHVSQAPVPIDPATTGVSPGVASIVSRLLRKDPADRFSSATELASALREARERPNVIHGGDGFADAPTSKFGAVAAAKPPPRRSVAPDRPETGQSREETGGYVAPGFDRRWIVYPALLLAAILIGFFALRGLWGPAKTIAVPDLTGQSAVKAQQQLGGLGLRFKVTYEQSEGVPQDQVIRQDPPAGTLLAANELVALVVSGGLPHVTIPDVKGYNRDDAQRRLQDAKLHYKVVEAYSAAIPALQVIDVSPAVGTSVPQNTLVTLTVSKGAKPIAAPDLVTLTEDDARKRLAALGLRLVVGQRTESDSIPAGVVASQDPPPGARVPPNSDVSVIVSTGPATVEIPTKSAAIRRAARRSSEARASTLPARTRLTRRTRPERSRCSNRRRRSRPRRARP